MRIECVPVFLGHCSATFDATNTTTACEDGLFTDPEGNDLVAVCILGRWLDIRHVGRAYAWTDQHGRDLPDGVMERITAASTADPLVEQQADFFASGLLMPGHLLRPIVNRQNFVSLSDFHDVRRCFQVSLTGMLVRWTQLSDFPCATIAMRDGQIQFGWISRALRDRGAYSLLRGAPVRGRDARAFIDSEPSIASYRDGTGSGAFVNWIDYDEVRLSTEEHYFAIPHTRTVWALVTADENDLASEWDD